MRNAPVMSGVLIAVTGDIHTRVDNAIWGALEPSMSVFSSRKSVTDVRLAENGLDGKILYFPLDVLANSEEHSAPWNH